MSILWDTLSHYDSKSLDDLLPLIGLKDYEGGQEEKLDILLDNMYKKSGIEPLLGHDALIKKSLKIASDKLDVIGIDWNTDTEEQIMDVIYDKYTVVIKERLIKVQKKLGKMKPEKRVKLEEDLKRELTLEDKTFIGSGGALFGALLAGEAAGFSLFTSTAVGLKAIGLLFGATFSFGTYSTVMSILGLVFGPIGWAAALSVVGLGGLKFFKGRKKNEVAAITITLLVDYRRKKEEEIQYESISYLTNLKEEVKEQIHISNNLLTFMENIDRPIDEVSNEAWYKNVISEFKRLKIVEA